MKAPVTRYLAHAVFWLATLLMLAVVGWTIHDANKKEMGASGWVRHTQKVLQHVSDVNDVVGRADSAQRSFLVRNSEAFRAERDRAFESANRLIDKIEALTSDNPDQQRRIHQLDELVATRIAIMRESERLSLAGETDESKIRAASGVGQEASAKIYAMTAQLRAEEIRLLELRNTEAELQHQTGLGALGAAVLIGVLILIPGYLGFILQARARAQTEKRLRVMADSLPGAMYQLKIDPRGKAGFTFISAGVSKVRGIDTTGELPDWDSFVKAIDERDRPAFVAAMVEATESMTPFRRDYRVMHADGTLRWLHHEAFLQKEGDGSILMNGYVADITQQRGLEEALLEAKETADSGNRAKSTFLATMSHEIRTPMNGVLGMLELLSLTKLDAEQGALLRVVRESSHSLLRIIDDILDFSKIEAGKLSVHPEVASIAEIFGHVHNLYAGNASGKGLLFKRTIDPRISPAVLVDPLRLRQILNNLVSNALKFTARGSIEMKADLIERVTGEDRVRFSLKDTGIGIAAELQQRLFQPFSQGDGDTPRRAGGTGLGLTICRRLADMMGGSIEMTSAPGEGTTMTLDLPLPIADPGDLPKSKLEVAHDALISTPNSRRMAPGIAQAEAEGTLVLLVDDHPTNRDLLVRQIHALGYAAESAGNGVEALEKWRTGRFGTVITDCNMPDMDGYELARRIRGLESGKGGKRIPIIACTANALGSEVADCFAAGMDDVLVKPVELSEVLKKLNQWLPIPDGFDMPETSPAASAPVDRSVLAGISGGDTAMEREIFTDFRRSNDEDAAVLERAVAASDADGVSRATHRMLGASRMVGALGFARVCERIGHANRVSNWTTVKADMGALHREQMRLNAFFDSL